MKFYAGHDIPDLYLLRLMYSALCYVTLRAGATKKQYFCSFFRYIIHADVQYYRLFQTTVINIMTIFVVIIGCPMRVF